MYQFSVNQVVNSSWELLTIGQHFSHQPYSHESLDVSTNLLNVNVTFGIDKRFRRTKRIGTGNDRDDI